MKKILYLTLLVGFSYSTDGHYFMENFPHDTLPFEMTAREARYRSYFEGILHGIKIGAGNTWKLVESGVLDPDSFVFVDIEGKTCELSDDQIFQMIKEYFDNSHESKLERNLADVLHQIVIFNDYKHKCK